MKKENELINKISIWYKMRYPDYVIGNIINIYEGKKVEYNSNFSINGKKVKVDEFHDYYNKEKSSDSNTSISEFIVAKHRNGPTKTIELLFKRDTSTFLSYQSGDMNGE